MDTLTKTPTFRRGSILAAVLLLLPLVAAYVEALDAVAAGHGSHHGNEPDQHAHN